MSLPLSWDAIDTVLLDMDGTLLDLYFDNHFWLKHLPDTYAMYKGIPLQAAHEELVARFGKEQGTLNWYCLDFWSNELDMDIVAHKHEVAHLIRPRAGALEFLEAITNSGRQAWLVTNAHHHSLSLKLDHSPFLQYCERIICAHEFRMPKEHPDFWAALQARDHFDPARTLFIDDSEAVLRSAERFGIAHLLTIAQPDSQRPPREGLHFAALQQFDDILPIPVRPGFM